MPCIVYMFCVVDLPLTPQAQDSVLQTQISELNNRSALYYISSLVVRYESVNWIGFSETKAWEWMEDSCEWVPHFNQLARSYDQKQLSVIHFPSVL
ncbi:hypothetical protein C5167_000759 [Papaver somniferum]|uniref:Uncharacterized protein n=1 Tax=Papaver somniferum TaxID=3469 RepID=A0A4Y7KVL8_PAPSO|nr:hypothetical protein C5167_000759 [Papaver somniferum]